MTETSVLTIRVPKQLKERIEVTAQMQGVSINQFALYAFTKELSELENSDYYKEFIKNKSKTEILENFDAAFAKVKPRTESEIPDWDSMQIAEVEPKYGKK